MNTAYSAWQIECLRIRPVPASVILNAERADVFSAVIRIAEIQLYGVILTAAAVSDAYGYALCAAAEINGIEADNGSSVKSAERTSVYCGNRNIREVAQTSGSKDIRILLCLAVVIDEIRENRAKKAQKSQPEQQVRTEEPKSDGND